MFDREAILTPDEVRGEHETLPKALKEDGWPALEDVRGKVMFALDNEDKIRDRYLEGHPASKDRLLFVSVKESDPSAGWMKVNDARPRLRPDPGARLRRLPRPDPGGYRTVEARKNDVIRRDRALSSGAQFVSTDFRVAVPEFSDYQVQLPGGVVARTNPVNGDKTFVGIDLEALPPRQVALMRLHPGRISHSIRRRSTIISR